MTNKELLDMAYEARRHAYAPYSHFAVGAALLSADGQVFTGCNIENAAYGETVCAERTAFFKAISQGVYGFLRIAIVGGPEDDPKPSRPCAPCGSCRQVMREFGKTDFEILLADGKEILKYTLEELLPCSFSEAELR